MTQVQDKVRDASYRLWQACSIFSPDSPLVSSHSRSRLTPPPPPAHAARYLRNNRMFTSTSSDLRFSGAGTVLAGEGGERLIVA